MRGEQQPSGRGAGQAGRKNQGLSLCVWHKGPPCSQETHVSNWILAATLRKRLFGKRKGIGGFQDCYRPRGPFIRPGRPAWARPLDAGRGRFGPESSSFSP